MTEPKMVRCEGSGQRVRGPDEPSGTVFCSVCGNSALPMKTTFVDAKNALCSTRTPAACQSIPP